MRDRHTLESVERMVASYEGWELFRAEALEQLGSKRDVINRLIHQTRVPVDPTEIEYFRGFAQGVMYVLDGLPNDLLAALKKQDKERDSE